MSVRSKGAYALFSLCLALVGLFVAYEGVRLSLGTLNRIGPGFFPLLLGVLIAVLSLATLIEKWEPPEARFNLRGLLLISGALLFFGVTVERLGFFVAAAGAVALTSLAQGRPRLITIIFVTAFLWVIGYFLFLTLLRIPLRPLPEFLQALG